VGNIYGSTGWPEWAAERQESKRLFAQLINADPSEIAFARATVEAESNVLNGMDIPAVGGNVVTNDLHYQGSIYNYKIREMEGLDVRIVKNNNWRVRAEDLEKVVDRNTKLIAISLVSNVNGYYADDVKAISELAHAHGALLYTDIIQAAGAIPIDVKAMGVDIAACSTYKFLQAEKGFGFLYIRKDLQGSAIKPTLHAGGVRFNYEPWTDNPDPEMENDIVFRPQTGPGQYEVSYPSLEGVISSIESLRYIHRLGIENIRNHIRELTGRLSNELPRLGHPSITPEGNESQIVVFASPDPEKTVEKLRHADVHVAMRWGNKMRISPSVYNNHDDVDRLLNALS